jgi:transketolase
LINTILNKSKKIRKIFLNLIIEGNKYHLGGSLSCLDFICTAIYGKFIKIDKDKGLRNFILSKGHALGVLHSILLEKKIIEKKTFYGNKKKGKIGGQLDIFNPLDFFEWNSGSLGHSVGISIGLSLTTRQKIWTMIGDAEIDEGSIWEALFFIKDKKIKNLVLVIDKNNVSASKKIFNKANLNPKILKSLGMKYFNIDGHDIKKIFKTLQKVNSINSSSLIILNTIKGKGILEIENNLKFSHQLPSNEILKKYI